MGMSIEKMYGSYSDADLNDWERLPMNASVLTSSAFGAWLLRRDERRDASIKANYENRLKTDMVAMLTEIQTEIEEKVIRKQGIDSGFEYDYEFISSEEVIEVIQQKINALKENKDG